MELSCHDVQHPSRRPGKSWYPIQSTCTLYPTNDLAYRKANATATATAAATATATATATAKAKATAKH